MNDAPLYTLRDVARQLGLPDSTVRYYRDAFVAYLPMVGSGRRRLYPPEAVEALRVVARGFAGRRRRDDIESDLAACTGGNRTTHHAAVPARSNGADLRRDEVLATVLDGERERREAMWQMARELFRLGETLERQQLLLNQLLERIAAGGRTLPPPVREAAPASQGAPAPAVTDDVEALREELARERELVERLRRSKLDIERRAAEAEARLAGGPAPAGSARRSLLDRLITRDQPR
jgi:DNA-binding transcriptional MerR regulator